MCYIACKYDKLLWVFDLFGYLCKKFVVYDRFMVDYTVFSKLCDIRERQLKKEQRRRWMIRDGFAYYKPIKIQTNYNKTCRCKIHF